MYYYYYYYYHYFKFPFSIKNTRNNPTNTPRVFHVETTWKPSFPRRFNVEFTWCVRREQTTTTFYVKK